MRSDKPEQHTDAARRHFHDGRAIGHEEGRLEGAREIVLALADRYGPIRDHLRSRVLACDAPELLRAIAVDLADAADVDAIELQLARHPVARVIEG
ncbi:MAG TPA: hypothetical protein VHE35_05060 [Kofleriaceae bacterium]|nr:hypothetical protein [Kofleriaceae bacterium]